MGQGGWLWGKENREGNGEVGGQRVDGARRPCCEGQEGCGWLGNLEGGLGKAGKGSEGRRRERVRCWGAEARALVPCQVWSVGVPWVPAPLVPGLARTVPRSPPQASRRMQAAWHRQPGSSGSPCSIPPGAGVPGGAWLEHHWKRGGGSGCFGSRRQRNPCWLRPAQLPRFTPANPGSEQHRQVGFASVCGSPTQLPPSHAVLGAVGTWGDRSAEPGAGVGGRFAPVAWCWGYQAAWPGAGGLREQRGVMSPWQCGCYFSRREKFMCFFFTRRWPRAAFYGSQSATPTSSRSPAGMGGQARGDGPPSSLWSKGETPGPQSDPRPRAEHVGSPQGRGAGWAGDG